MRPSGGLVNFLNRLNKAGHFLRIRQWGGHLQKGPYYTERREMIDGLLVTKSLVRYRI
jgi:hypothetical protein